MLSLTGEECEWHVQVPLEIPSGDGEKAEEAVTAAMALLEKGSRARTTAANGALPP